MARTRHQAATIGFVFSTGECGVAAQSVDGKQAYAGTPMDGKALWRGWPSHYLQHVPEMMSGVLAELQGKGWSFDKPGYLSQSWRQHDLAIVDKDNTPLLPALSWECNGAKRETRILNREVADLRETVGRIEERFVASKLPWALAQLPSLKRAVHQVMLSGDWVAGMLTGDWALGASDAVCNGLLDQQTKELASRVLKRAGTHLDGRLKPSWFPPVIRSDAVVGRVRSSHEPSWNAVTRLLKGWRVVTTLGDNHATAAGCGAADYETVVLSLGTSGTVNRVCPPTAKLRGQASQFEYWDDRLLLMMLAKCAAWYNLFKQAYEPTRSFAELNDLGQTAPCAKIRLVSPPPESVNQSNDYCDPQLAKMDSAIRTASVQFSIAYQMLRLSGQMLREVRRPAVEPRRFVLTGGLVQAPLIRATLATGLRLMRPHAEVMLSNRTGALAYKTDALGARYNAMAAAERKPVQEVIAAHRKLKRCPSVDATIENGLKPLLVGLT